MQVLLLCYDFIFRYYAKNVSEMTDFVGKRYE